jgi:hypothetical protein
MSSILACLGGPVLVLVVVSSGVAAQEPQAPAPLAVGMNLRSVTPRDRELVFADAFKLASPWQYLGPDGFQRRPGQGEGLAGDKGPERVPLDEHGWPLPESARAIACAFFLDMRNAYPAGEYVCTWQGSGRIDFEGSGRVIERGERRLVVAVDPARGELVLRAEGCQRADPLRDIRLWFPGLEGRSSPFHPLFLERLRPFATLRFYPWMRVYTASGRWAERARPSDARQSTEQGVALEYMLALCNELDCEPWFTLPHTADDEYVQQFATLVRDSLRPGARVWVEFSNELWNTDLPSGRWAQQEAQKRGLRSSELVAERAARVFRIWREVFAGSEQRVQRVAAGHLFNPGYTRALCRALGGELDAIAVGAYFGVRPDRDGSGPSSTAAHLLATARANLEQLVLPRLEEHGRLAARLASELARPVAFVAYEGGPSIVARGTGGRNTLDPLATYECQQAPEMYTLYRELLEGAHERGLGLFVAYDFVGDRTPSDTFSHLTALDQPLASAPKYRALIAGQSREDAR